jgi:hypothetical protein
MLPPSHPEAEAVVFSKSSLNTGNICLLCVLRYGFFISDLVDSMESQVPTGLEAGWALEPVWTIWRIENSCLHLNTNSNPSVVQAVASCYTDGATTALP